MHSTAYDRSVKNSRFCLSSNKVYLCHLSGVCLYNLDRDVIDVESGFSLFFEIYLGPDRKDCVFSSREIKNNCNPVWNDVKLNDRFDLKTNDFYISIYGTPKGHSRKLLGTFHIHLSAMFFAKNGIPTPFIRNSGLLLNAKGKFYYYPRVYDVYNYEGISSLVSCNVLEQKAVYSYGKKMFWILQNQEQIVEKLTLKINCLMKKIRKHTNEAIINILEDENIDKTTAYTLLLNELTKNSSACCKVLDSDYTYLISKMAWLGNEISRTEKQNFDVFISIENKINEQCFYKQKSPEMKSYINSVVKKIEVTKRRLATSHNKLEDVKRKNHIRKQKMFTYLFQIYPFHRSIQNRVINKLFCGIPMPSVLANNYPTYNQNYVSIGSLGQLKGNVLLTASTSYAFCLSHMIFTILDVRPIFPISFDNFSPYIKDIINGKGYHVSGSIGQLNYAYSLLRLNLIHLCRLLDIVSDKEDNVFNMLYRIINRMSEPKSDYNEREGFNLAADLFMERLCVESVASTKSTYEEFSDNSGEIHKMNSAKATKSQSSEKLPDNVEINENPDTYLTESIAEIAARITTQSNF